MAQTDRFYTLHGENGQEFCRLFLSTGLLCKKVGFPVRQVFNVQLVNLYLCYVLNKHLFLNGEISQADYLKSKENYLNEVKKYHIPRKSLQS